MEIGFPIQSSKHVYTGWRSWSRLEKLSRITIGFRVCACRGGGHLGLVSKDLGIEVIQVRGWLPGEQLNDSCILYRVGRIAGSTLRDDVKQSGGTQADLVRGSPTTAQNLEIHY